MKKLGITAGVIAVAVLAIAYAFTSDRSEKAHLAMEPVASEPAAMSPAPAAAEDAEIRLEAVATDAPKAPEAKQPSKTRGLLMTQDRTGTECKTPSGRVCIVEPGRINSPCDCGGQNGLIIR